MTNPIEPGEALEALAEMERRQEHVIEEALVPVWYWWAVALPTVALGVVVDFGASTLIATTAAIYGVSMALLTGWLVLGGLSRVKVSERLLGPRGAVLIVGFVWLVVGGTLLLAFALHAADVRSAGTFATLACAIVLVLGGPLLMRRLRTIMRRQAGVG